jgi:hypothetical protein
MIQERDEFQRSINQEDDEDCIECVWMYDSNLNRELLKFVFLQCSSLVVTHHIFQPQHDGYGSRFCGESEVDTTDLKLHFRSILLNRRALTLDSGAASEATYICEHYCTHK